MNELVNICVVVGLKKFLSQYPSLFMIKGDYVDVNSFAPPQDEETNGSKYNASGKRDYAAEAVDYFSKKLVQYGPNTEVPIKCILGHRSQASPGVRHISGQHIKEFKDFLLKFPDTFMIIEENVVLKKFDENNIPEFHNSLPLVTIDPVVTQKLLDFFAQCIEIKGE